MQMLLERSLFAGQYKELFEILEKMTDSRCLLFRINALLIPYHEKSLAHLWTSEEHLCPHLNPTHSSIGFRESKSYSPYLHPLS